MNMNCELCDIPLQKGYLIANGTNWVRFPEKTAPKWMQPIVIPTVFKLLMGIMTESYSVISWRCPSCKKLTFQTV